MASSTAVRHPVLFTILIALSLLPAIAARDNEQEGDRVGFLPTGAAVETCGVAVLGVCHREREQREGALLLVL